jgi:TonB family protein
MSLAIPADRSTDAQGLLPRLGYFVLGSLVLHALVVAVWRGEPAAGPEGQSTFQITLLARYGDTPDKPGAEAGHEENNDTPGSVNRSESPSERSATDEPGGRNPSTDLAVSLQRVTQAAPDLPQPDTRSHAGIKKLRNKAPEEEKFRVTERRAALAQGRISVTSGAASHGQHQLSSAARYRRVRAALHEALLPRFDYPSVARRRGWQGRVQIGLHVEADGDLSHIHLVESSGYAPLDRAAVKNVTELRNVPAAIQWLDGLDMDMILPVRYRLHDR